MRATAGLPSRMVDTLVPPSAPSGAKHSLDALCARYGIDRAFASNMAR